MSKKKRSDSPATTLRRKDLISAVTDFLTQNKEKQFNYKQIAAALNVKGEEARGVLMSVLDKSRDDKVVLRPPRGRNRINDRGLLLEGRFERRSNGKNFSVPTMTGIS